MLKVKPKIVVYTMGKTASTSVLAAFEYHGFETYSTHILSKKNEHKSKLSYANNDLYQNDLSGVLEKAYEARNKIDKNTKFVSATREPISHAISVMFQNYKKLFRDNSINTHNNFNDFFVRTYDEAIEGGNFPRHYMCMLAVYFMDWEISPFLGIDVYQEPFEGNYKIYDNKLLLIKFERINYLKQAVKKFIGLDDFDLKQKHFTTNKEVGELYKKVKNTIQIPKHISDWVKSTRYFQHFYKDFVPFWERNYEKYI